MIYIQTYRCQIFLEFFYKIFRVQIIFQNFFKINYTLYNNCKVVMYWFVISNYIMKMWWAFHFSKKKKEKKGSYKKNTSQLDLDWLVTWLTRLSRLGKWDEHSATRTWGNIDWRFPHSLFLCFYSTNKTRRNFLESNCKALFIYH